MQIDMHALMVSEAPDALIALDPAGLVRLWNRSAEAVFGHAAADAIGRPIGELIDPPGHAGTAADLEQARAGGLVQGESMRCRSDGTLIYVNSALRALRDTAGQVEAFFCAMSDVTPMRVQRDSQMVHAQYHEGLEFAPDAIVIVNESGRILLFNAQARQMFGYEGDEVIGQPIEMLLPERLRRGHVRHRNGFLAAPRMRPMGQGLELFGVRRNGDEFPIEISLSPIDRGDGRLVMSAIRDSSERRRFERTLHEKNIELERASRAKDHFLATMSHELRTPLNAILGFTGLLLMQLQGPLTEVQRRHLEYVQSSGKHLLSLINDLLDLAKIESGRVELVLEPVDCVPVIDEVVQTLRPTAQAKQLRIDFDLPGSGLRVMVDDRALQQIILNLTGNAVKFTETGEVRLAARQVDVDGRAMVEIDVRDTGVGISVADQARLFEAFQQVGDRLRRPQGGTGLGLNLSRKLAELMGGEIAVQSEPGRGSCFTVRLVAARQAD